MALKDGLKARGHHVKIITPHPRNHELMNKPDIIFAGTSTDFRTLSFTHTTSQVSSTADNDHIDKVLADEQFDILHFHEPWMPLLSRQLLQRSKSVNIATFHAKVPESIASRTVLRVVTPYLNSVMKYLDFLTAVSPSAAEYAAGLTDKPIAIIPNGIDLEKYQQSKPVSSAPQPNILYIGRLERRKGVKYLLQAFELFASINPKVRLLIVGDGPERERLELIADDLKLKHVRFLGFVSEATKLRLLRQADIFCSPAIFGESFGIVLLEAMASGAVTVAGNNSGYSDLMQGVGAMSIINPDDTLEFARRLNTFFQETKLRKVWQDWAERYVKQFSYINIVDQYEALYKDALRYGPAQH